VKRGVPARPGTEPLQSRDVDIAQLKQLIEIQTQIVRQAKQNELAQKHHKAPPCKLAGVSRRFFSFLSQLW
jgi:hypothetical protein